MSVIPVNRRCLFLCIAVVLLLCMTQVTGNTLLILSCLGVFMLLVAWYCGHDFTLPTLLFFLPWSPLLRTDPNSFSFYTFAMVMISLISIVKNGFYFRKYQIKAGVLTLLVTLISKLIVGRGLTFDYVAFIMMLVFIPSLKEEWSKKRYNLYQLVIFFSVGIIIAALLAMWLSDFSNIRKYIRVDSYLTIIRRSGFYGDANFYTAQILAALAGLLTLLLYEKSKSHLIVLTMLTLMLIYCGFISGSKSFVITFMCILLIWGTAIFRMRGKTGIKFFLLTISIISALYIASSSLFSELIDVLQTRFSSASDLESFTTGRISLWQNYINEILGNIKVFSLGEGFTNIKVDGRNSHSTVIQLLYQFGLFGAPVIIYWVVCFFRPLDEKKTKRRKISSPIMLILIGSFMPWLAIDILFFDEFFLLQMYVCLAIKEFNTFEDLQSMHPKQNNLPSAEGNYERTNTFNSVR